MIYAIDANKNHRVVSKGNGTAKMIQYYLRHGETIVQADADGWIEWDGGDKCPLPESWLCDAKGIVDSCDGGPAGDLFWPHVIAYRPILPEQPVEQPAEAEWDGSGFPPVGAKVRIDCPPVETGNAEVVGEHYGRVIVWTYSKMEYRAFALEYIEPIRTPEQRAEDDAVQAMVDVAYQSGGLECHVTNEGAAAIYAAILDGKIPGVKVEL